MNNGKSSNQQHDEWDALEEYFEEDPDLLENLDDSETNEEESEQDEELPVFDPLEDDFDPPQASDDLLDDPLIMWLAIDGEV